MPLKKENKASSRDTGQPEKEQWKLGDYDNFMH
jgi:hypothetical protein